MDELRQQLLSQIEIVPGPLATECWLWTGSGIEYGYLRGTLAHRLSFIAFNGPIEGWNYILHRCDTPRCINPEHLWQGSQHDNVLDAIAKGHHRACRRKPIKVSPALVSNRRRM